MNHSNTPLPDSYMQYICGGVHCKCMNLDGECKNYHNGDHICPMSKTPLEMAFTYRGKLYELKGKPGVTTGIQTSSHTADGTLNGQSIPTRYVGYTEKEIKDMIESGELKPLGISHD